MRGGFSHFSYHRGQWGYFWLSQPPERKLVILLFNPASLGIHTVFCFTQDLNFIGSFVLQSTVNHSVLFFFVFAVFEVGSCRVLATLFTRLCIGFSEATGTQVSLRQKRNQLVTFPLYVTLIFTTLKHISAQVVILSKRSERSICSQLLPLPSL